MTESERIADLERRFSQLQNQVLAMSELLGSQSSLITQLSTQQVENSQGLSRANDLLRNIAKALETPDAAA